MVGRAWARVAARVRRLPGFRRAPVTPDPPAEVPSADSVARLDGRLRAVTRGHRERLRDDLARVDVLLRLGEEESAAEALEEYAAVLRAYETQLEEAVGEAVAVREAERLTAERAPAGEPPADPSGAAGEGPLRRTASVLVLVLALVLGSVLSSATERPALDAQLAAVEAELAEVHTRLLALTRERSSDTNALVEAHELHDRILALHSATLADERIKATIDRLLALEERALEPLVTRTLEARRLLAEIRALRSSLELEDEARERTSAEDPEQPSGAEPAADPDADRGQDPGPEERDSQLSNGLVDVLDAAPGSDVIDAAGDAADDTTEVRPDG